MNIQELEDQQFTYASDSDWDNSEALELGENNIDSAWVLTDRDVWHKNPFYTGPDVPHPEDTYYEDYE